MNKLTRLLRRTKLRISPQLRSRRLTVTVLVAVTVLGAIWLAFGRSPQVPLPTDITRPGGPFKDVSAAIRDLSAAGIKASPRNGRVFVAEDDLIAAQAVLARQETAAHHAIDSFERLAEGGSMWTTHAQNEKRWQAAKMSALSRLIEMFPTVSSATVIFEPGQPRGLGSVGAEPTAAVKVELTTQAEMSEKLAAAIADLVCGSVTGMQRQNVRIIDSNGRSYRLTDETLSDGQTAERLRQAERHSAQRIQDALGYIPNVIVIAMGMPESHSPRAIVYVPRSYLGSVFRHAHGDRVPSQQDIDSVAVMHLPKIQRMAASAIGAGEVDSVSVDWYYDVSGEVHSSAFPVWRSRLILAATGGAAVLAIAALAGLIVLKRNRRNPPGDGGRGADLAAHQKLAFLAQADVEELVRLFQQEHPQAIAVVLAHLTPARAATVLAAFDAPRQVEIARRIASLNEVDEEVIRELEGMIASRLKTNGRQNGAGGAQKLAHILSHADYATEKSIMEALSGDAPNLASTIRRKLFEFDDIIHVPARNLRAAMEKLDVEELAVSMRTTGEGFREKIFSALPSRLSKKIRDAMDQQGPVRLSDVESAQQHVVEMIRQMEAGEYLCQRPSSEKQVLA